MKKIGAIVAVLLVATVSANAAITATSVHLRINTVTGQGYLVNSGADVIPLTGVYIKAATGKTIMIPDVNATYDLASHWASFSNGTGTHMADLAAAGLTNVAGWSRLSNTTNYLGESVLGDAASLAAGAVIPLGRITTGTVQSDFSTTAAFKWAYTDTSTHTMTNNTIEFTPEPATMSLLVIGGIATLIRRRR